MLLLLSAPIIFGALVLLIFTRFLKKQPSPYVLEFADTPIESLVIRKLSGSEWVFHWKNFQGWGYEFEKEMSGPEPSDRVILKFSNIIVEVHGWNLRRIKAGVVSYTLSLLQEVREKDAQFLRGKGEPVIKQIEVIPLRGARLPERGMKE